MYYYHGNRAFNKSYNAQINGETGVVKNIEEIGILAFGWCSGLTGNLIIPNSVTSVGNQAFYSVPKVTVTSQAVKDLVSAVYSGIILGPW